MIFPPFPFSQSSYSATVYLTFYLQRGERNGEEQGSSTREAGQGAQTLVITAKNKGMGQDESPSSCTDCRSTAFFCLSMGRCISSSFGVLPSSASLRFLLIHPVFKGPCSHGCGLRYSSYISAYFLLSNPTHSYGITSAYFFIYRALDFSSELQTHLFTWIFSLISKM